MYRKSLLIVALMSVLCSNLFSQTYVTQIKPAGGKFWGYANSKGEIIIDPQFAKCYKFSPEGFAPIYDSKERQYYFITLKGEKMKTEVTEFKVRDGMGFDVEGFKNGMAMIKQGDKWGYLDASGKLAIKAKYDDANDFDGGFATAKIGEKYFVLNTKGDEIPVVAADIIDIKDFTEGLAPFKTADKRFGFIGTDGKIAIPSHFESVGYFHNELAWAKQLDGTLGYINTKGEWMIKPQFAAGKNFDKESGLARVKSGERWAYVTRTGEMVYVNETDVWGDFYEGLAEGRKNGKKGFYNNKGTWVIAPQFDGTRDFQNGFAAAKMGDKWGVIDKQGKWVIQPTFDGIKDMEVVK